MITCRRISINICVTYVRSLVVLICGVFVSRWVLMALGTVDFGLYGLIGGLTVFISFFNSLLGGAVGRFYAFSLGRGADQGSDDVSAWFNTAVFLHCCLSVGLIVVGYPVGEWLVRHWLTIPSERIKTCVWVFRWACGACFIGMIAVPFSALYVAKQYIAELTIYGLVSTIGHMIFAFYIVHHPGEWLARYAFGLGLIVSAPQLLVMARAASVFPECRIRGDQMWNARRVRQLGGFVGAQLFGCLGGLFRNQGMAVVTNKFFGPGVNAAMNVANSVNAQTAALVAAMQGAFTPAIVQACGAGKDPLMRAMAYRSCKLGMLMVLVFAIPLALEMQSVMNLWLKTPPPFAADFCLCMLAMLVLDKCSIGQMIALNAKGRVTAYNLVVGGGVMLTVPVAVQLIHAGLGVRALLYAWLALSVASTLGRVAFAQALVGMRASYWARKIVGPVLVAAGVSAFAALVPRLLLSVGWLRILWTTLTSSLVLMPMAWFFVLDCDEREFVIREVKGRAFGI